MSCTIALQVRLHGEPVMAVGAAARLEAPRRSVAEPSGGFPDNRPAVIPLGTLAALFTRLGATAFGGPAAHIALLHYEVVQRRRWLREAEFADYLAITNLIPGPNSTEMAIHVGRRMAGWGGFAVAGVCFILPAALIVGVLAAAYVRYGALPEARAILDGITPVVVAIIAHAALAIGRSALRTPARLLIAAAAAALMLWGANELLILVLAGATSALAGRATLRSVFLVPAAAVLAQPPVAQAAAVSLPSLFLYFLKIGSVLFGSGYVLVAFLRADLVHTLSWLTDQQLLDAIAIGQATPGPLFTTATFIGFVLRGVPGAVVATAGIFLPAFLFVALTGPIVRRMRGSARAGAFLDGVVAASIGLIAAVGVQLALTLAGRPLALALCAASLAVLWWRQPNATWLIAAGGAVGWLAF